MKVISLQKKRFKSRRTLTILISLVALITGTWAIFENVSKPESGRGNTIQVGAKAPEFTAVNSIGEQVRLSDYRGKAVMINFWASWCVPCVREMPLVHQIAQDYQNDMETLFVNVGESKGTIREFMDKQAFDFPVIIDVTGNISGMYRITGLPATMVIDRDGEFRHILLGELTEDIPLQQWLEDSI